MDDEIPQKDQQLLLLTQHFLQENGSERAARLVRLNAMLEQDLGIGSLEKAELFHRIEHHFSVQLPESLLAQARTLDEIARVLDQLPVTQTTNYKQSSLLDVSVSAVDPNKAETINEVLTSYAKTDPSRVYLYIQHEETEKALSYSHLFEKASQVAGGLAAMGISPGDTVAIMLPTSEDFFYAFYGVLLSGATPVPIYPPMRLDQIEEYANKEATILYNAGVKVLISFKEAKNLNKLLKPFVPSLTDVIGVNDLIKRCKSSLSLEVDADDIALLQYTSGSTGNPKGVVLTHTNLLANIKAYGDAINIAPSDVVVSWLPLYHDMGLIGTVMGCLYYGIPLVLMSPLAFLSRPENWLWAIHYRRATLTAAPNFAYELCAKKVKEAEIEGLDLSSLRLAFNGAEAIYPKTLDRFTKKFKPYGFKKKTFFPVFGLAESSVALTFPPIGREPLIDYVDRESFEKEQKAVPAGRDKRHAYEFVSCGSALKDHQIRVVDHHDQALPDRVIGRLQFCGPSSMQGYYRNTEATEAVYHDGWWDTGDMAYIVNGELFITGREKDLIIKAGRNYYPQEIEDAASDVDGVRKGCVVAFGIVDKESGTEKIIVVVEKNPRSDASNESIINAVSKNVADRTSLPPDQVVIAGVRSIPKTSSGKLRRASCKQLYQDGLLSKQPKSTQLQLVKLFFGGIGRKFKKLLINIGKAFFTAYVGIIFLATFLPLCLFVSGMSQPRMARWFKRWAKLLTRLIFCPMKVNNLYTGTTQTPLYVANHTSYVDAIFLMAALPANIRFVGKQELLKLPLLGRMMKRLGHIFIDRMDISKNEADLSKILSVIESGHPVLFFPEGTFTRVTGVRPFKLGPFKLAADNNLPIRPVAIKNARGILRAHSFLLSPRFVTITILSELTSQGMDWQNLASVRDQVRYEISKYCGEQPIDLIVAGPEH